MISHIDILEVEQSELSNKIIKLLQFFDTDIFESLNSTDQSLLTTQYSAMVTYSDLLRLRLNRAKAL